MKITKVTDTFDIDVKRFYLPFLVMSACPECKKEATTDLQERYLSYPCSGENKITFCHPWADEDEEQCQNEWSETVVLGITLEPA